MYFGNMRIYFVIITVQAKNMDTVILVLYFYYINHQVLHVPVSDRTGPSSGITMRDRHLMPKPFPENYKNYIYMGYAVVQLVEALRYEPEGRGFDSRFNIIVPAALWPWG